MSDVQAVQAGGRRAFVTGAGAPFVPLAITRYRSLVFRNNGWSKERERTAQRRGPFLHMVRELSLAAAVTGWMQRLSRVAGTTDYR